MKFQISTDNPQRTWMDLDRLLLTRLLVQSNSGGGKSWLLRRILEQTFGEVQHLVLDPEGEFSTLREKHDYVLVAKTGGDIAADPRTARLLAERLLALGASAILDLYELSPRDRIKFVKEFLEGVVDAPKNLWHPVLVVLDEAHHFDPEKGHGEAESADAVKALASKGRKRGFCAILATQRLSKLSKDTCAELNNKLIGRTGLDVDVKRAQDELGLSKPDAWKLREMEAGQFMAFGPALTKTVTRVKVGPVFTSHPVAGNQDWNVVAPPSAKVKALLAKLSDLPQEVERKKKTEEDLRNEITDLRRQLLQKVAAPTPERVEVEVVSPARLAALRDFGTVWSAGARNLQEATAGLERLGRDLIATVDRLSRKNTHEAKLGRPPKTVAIAASPVGPSLLRAPLRKQLGPPASLGGPEDRILNGLAELSVLGVERPDRRQAALMADYTNLASKGFRNAMSRLSAAGFITYPSTDTVSLTDAGWAEVKVLPEKPETTAEVQERFMRLLGETNTHILRALIDAYPEPMERTDVAAAAGYGNLASKGFRNALSRLSALGLIEYPSRDQAKARPILFLEESAR